MSKHGSIKHQVSKAINPLIRYGMDKHEIKTKRYKASLLENRKINPISVDGIYAIKSYGDIYSQLKKFAEFIKEQNGKPLYAVTVYDVDCYIQKLKDEGKSPATIKLAEYAIWKALGLHSSIKLEPVKRQQITRSRLQRKHDQLIDVNKFKDEIDFVLACGCRRKGLESVKFSDIFEKGGRYFVHLKEKGGYERDAVVLLAYQNRFMRLINARKQNADNCGLIFGPVHRYLDVHSYRRKHLQMYYGEILSKFNNMAGKGGDGIYKRRDDGKVFDRYALKLVSRQAGHKRLDIIVKHYLD